MPNSDHDPFEQLSSAPTSPASKAKSASAGSGLSLKARAVGFLSRREHSRAELARKLSAHVDPDNPGELDKLLDQLEKENWLSDQRFAQSLVNRRASKKGAALVAQELRRHGVSDEQVAQLHDQLKSTETVRAREVWEKKFGQPPANAKEYARQFRFLASRGFSPDCLRKILGDADD